MEPRGYPTAVAMQNMQNTPPPSRPDTELESVIATVHGHLQVTLDCARQIAERVLPPTPTPGGAANISPIAVTYQQKMVELATLADTLRYLVGELNGRI